MTMIGHVPFITPQFAIRLLPDV